MKKWNSALAFVIFVVVMILFSCSDKDKTEMTYDEKIQYDSLKYVKFKNLRNQTDAWCETKKDSLFNKYVDSLLTLRRSEIEQLFDK